MSWGWFPLESGRQRFSPTACGYAAMRLHLEHVLGYAPDLNPDEGIGTT